MNFNSSLTNIAERAFLGKLLQVLKPVVRLSTIEWAETNRVMASTESSIVGKFDCSRTPAFEYLYHLCDNWHIHIVGCMKSSQVGASEMENNVIGKVMDLTPCNAAVFFPGVALLKEYSRKRFQPFFRSCTALREKVNIGIAKPSHDYFSFIGGSLSLKTLGSIQSVLSSPIPFIILEEFAQVKAEVAKQGDPLGLVMGRQKSFFIGMKKVLAFSTPTFKDFCNMEKLFNKGLSLVFKAQCHECKNLVELSGWTMDNFIQYHEYSNRYIDDTFGKYDPDTAYFACPHCNTRWSFEQKTQNIIAGKAYGFIDDCGDFSLGWHSRADDKEVLSFAEYQEREASINKPALKRALKENKTSLIYSLQYPEILSCFEATSDAIALATKKILAERAVEKGDETLLKDWFNNSKGLPYTSGDSSIEAAQLITFRRNYPEHICPMEGLILTAGVDVQINRFAIVIRAWGQNNNSYLVSWYEIFGDTVVQERDANGKFIGVWGELAARLVLNTIPHASGKPMRIGGVSIDSGDNTENVYRWVQAMNDMGAHRAHEEVLRRVSLNLNPDARSNMYYHNEQSYGQYEEQITSCRKLIDVNSSYSKPVYKLIPGKRKEAMDCEKNALHAAYALGIRNYSFEAWKALEDYYYEA